MPKKNFSEEYARLVKQAEECSRAYYENDAPLVDDARYDALMREIEELELSHPELKEGPSVTDKVGGKASAKFASVRHDPPLLSLGNIFTPEDLDEFNSRLMKNSGLPVLEYAAELKFDGLAVELVYEKGVLVQ
ncbi:MAG: DNA ligase LigA-related protein, partial [Spirochaetota bacterium]